MPNWFHQPSIENLQLHNNQKQAKGAQMEQGRFGVLFWGPLNEGPGGNAPENFAFWKIEKP